MTKILKITTIIAFIVTTTLQSYADDSSEPISNYAQNDQQNKNMIFSEDIYTVQLYKSGDNLSNPFISLKSEETIDLHFDLISSNMKTFYYTFVHCNKDWEESDLTTFDYLDGFPENEIKNVTPSFNTTVSYYHYALTFPNDEINFRYSGNYLLKVFINSPDNPVIIRRFVITEDLAAITASIHLPQMSLANNSEQQIEFTVNIAGKGVIDPSRTVWCSVLQNGRWDNSKNNLQANIQNDSELRITSLSQSNIFKGGNEYRSFDIRDIQYNGQNVRDIVFLSPYYNMYLNNSENRGSKPYFSNPDFNGKYYVALKDGRDYNIEADYIWVHFSFPMKNPSYGSSVFIHGALSDWSIDNKRFAMEYDDDKEVYKASLLLKQGWYNFEYALVTDSRTIDEMIFEGSHYETVNEYTIFIYYRNPRERYDRVIGYCSVESKGV